MRDDPSDIDMPDLALLAVGIVAKDGPEGVSGRVDGKDQRGRADIFVIVDGEKRQEVDRDRHVLGVPYRIGLTPALFMALV